MMLGMTVLKTSQLAITDSLTLKGELHEMNLPEGKKQMYSLKLVGDSGPIATWSIPTTDKVIIQAKHTIKLSKDCILLSAADATDFAKELGIPTEHPAS